MRESMVRKGRVRPVYERLTRTAGHLPDENSRQRILVKFYRLFEEALEEARTAELQVRVKSVIARSEDIEEELDIRRTDV